MILPRLVLIVFGDFCGQARGDITDRISLTPMLIEEGEAELRRLVIVRNDPWIMHDLGRVVLRAGRIQEARGLWDRAAKREPNLPSANVALAIEFTNQGLLAAARKALQQAALENDNDPHLHLARGNLAVREGDLEA